MLKVVDYLPGTKDELPRFVCMCECGNQATALAGNVRSGRTKSCGCSQNTGDGRRTHAMSESTEYRTWRHIKGRCHSPTNAHYRYYGARGISMCREWRDSFEAFFAYVGPRPSTALSLDRINNDGNYEPGNVRWTDSRTQARNRRTVKLTPESVKAIRARVASGETMASLARELGVDPGLIAKVRDRRIWVDVL